MQKIHVKVRNHESTDSSQPQIQIAIVCLTSAECKLENIEGTISFSKLF